MRTDRCKLRQYMQRQIKWTQHLCLDRMLPLVLAVAVLGAMTAVTNDITDRQRTECHKRVVMKLDSVITHTNLCLVSINTEAITAPRQNMPAEPDEHAQQGVRQTPNFTQQI